MVKSKSIKFPFPFDQLFLFLQNNPEHPFTEKFLDSSNTISYSLLLFSESSSQRCNDFHFTAILKQLLLNSFSAVFTLSESVCGREREREVFFSVFFFFFLKNCFQLAMPWQTKVLILLLHPPGHIPAGFCQQLTPHFFP